MFIILYRGMITSQRVVKKIRCGRFSLIDLCAQSHLGAQELQGTLLVTLRNSNQTIDDGEVRRKFQQFGDVKSVRPAGERHELVSSPCGGFRAYSVHPQSAPC
jgi:hypothetical protein